MFLFGKNKQKYCSFCGQLIRLLLPSFSWRNVSISHKFNLSWEKIFFVTTFSIEMMHFATKRIRKKIQYLLQCNKDTSTFGCLIANIHSLLETIQVWKIQHVKQDCKHFFSLFSKRCSFRPGLDTRSCSKASTNLHSVNLKSLFWTEPF